MTEYRTDRKRELRENLERLADEETLDQNALAQMAKDLEITSQAEAAEARLRVRGVDAVKREDREEARKCVDNLLKKAKDAARDKQLERKQLYQIASKIAKVTAIVAAGLAAIGAPVYATAHYWNTRDEALEALAKYDKPMKITDPQERAEVISHLDEIFEEHGYDHGSDIAAERYLVDIEDKGYKISERAKLLDTIGKKIIDESEIQTLELSVFQYDFFVSAKKIEPRVGECLLSNLGRSNSEYILSNLEHIYNQGICK